jgi:hypothetical protein
VFMNVCHNAANTAYPYYHQAVVFKSNVLVCGPAAPAAAEVHCNIGCAVALLQVLMQPACRTPARGAGTQLHAAGNM